MVGKAHFLNIRNDAGNRESHAGLNQVLDINNSLQFYEVNQL